MRRPWLHLGACAALVLQAGVSSAGDRAPVYVVSTRGDVPVMINGRDARGAIVVGDWGLSRPGHVQPVVLDPPLMNYREREGAYFPLARKPPRLGRLEFDRPSRSYEAEPFFRSWGAGSREPHRPAEYPSHR